MGIRETMNRNPVIAAAVAVALIAAAGWWGYTTFTDRGGTADAPRFYYYTADDGRTFFSMSASEIPPIMKDGREAVRAHIYSCDKGKSTCAVYLEKYTGDFKKFAEAERAKPKDPNPKGPVGMGGGMNSPAAAFARLVKKPGDKQWVRATSSEGGKIVIVSCPTGSIEDLVEKLP